MLHPAEVTSLSVRRFLLLRRSSGPMGSGALLRRSGVEGLGKLGVLAHPVAIAADVDDVAMVQESVDERGGHDFVTQDFAPVLEALVRRQHCGCAFIAAVDQLKEQHRTLRVDGQVTDLIYDEERRMGEGLQAVCKLASGLGLLQRGDEVDKGAVVDPAAGLREVGSKSV